MVVLLIVELRIQHPLYLCITIYVVIVPHLSETLHPLSMVAFLASSCSLPTLEGAGKAREGGGWPWVVGVVVAFT